MKLQQVKEKKVARITVATNMAFADRNGGAVIETQWHNVSAWEGKRITGLEKLKVGDKIGVIGRIRYNKFTGTDGQEHSSTDILAYRLTIIEDDDVFAYEM